MTLALFDFDGTLTCQDSFKTLLQSTCSKPIFYWKYYIRCLPTLLAYRLRKASTQTLKARRIAVFLSPLSSEKLISIIANFNTNHLPNIVKKSGIERIKWHQSAGHRVIVISASFDFILHDWCTKQGVELLTNTLKKDATQRLTAVFEHPDCNYQEKVNRLNQHLLLADYTEIYAYGDTAGDQPMLALAQHPHYCFFS